MKDLKSRSIVDFRVGLVTNETCLPPLLECYTIPQNMDLRDAFDNLYFLFPIGLFFCWFTVPEVKTSYELDCFTKRPFSKTI